MAVERMRRGLRPRSADRIDPRDAEHMRQLVFTLGFPEETKHEIMRVVYRDTVQVGVNRKGWFIMIYPAQFAWVHDQASNSAWRPKLCASVWAHLPMFIRMDTGEVVRSRAELAVIHKCHVRDISRAMHVLAKVGAIRRVPDGRGVRYFLNPNVGTHIASEAARSAEQGRWPDVPAPSCRDLFSVVDGDR